MSEDVKTCRTCVKRQDIAGNAHIGCRTMPSVQALIVAYQGRWPLGSKAWPGCGAWPVSFDENVIPDPCPLWSDDAQDRVDDGWDKGGISLAQII